VNDRISLVVVSV